MHIKWLSQCQRAFAAEPAAGRRISQALRQIDTFFFLNNNITFWKQEVIFEMV